jgi:predicted DNA-binding protein (UPF0251 family)
MADLTAFFGLSMPAQRVGLRMIKDVIRLKWEARLSHDKIATALGISKGLVQKYVALARKQPRGPSVAQVEALGQVNCFCTARQNR